DPGRPSQRGKGFDQPPAGIALAWEKPQPRRTWKGVMVVVPAFAHRNQPGDANIMALHRCAVHNPALPAPAMREMPDKPMTGYANADTHADSPYQPGRAAQQVKQQCPGQLLHHPGAFEAAIETVLHQARLQLEPGRT